MGRLGLRGVFEASRGYDGGATAGSSVTGCDFWCLLDKLGPQRGSPEGVSGCLHHIRFQSLIPREVRGFHVTCRVLKTEKSEQTLVWGKHRLLLGDFGLSWLQALRGL